MNGTQCRHRVLPECGVDPNPDKMVTSRREEVKNEQRLNKFYFNL